jgi:class 3 adenylate cyclase
MNHTMDSLKNLLQYQNHLYFPGYLERDYRKDYSSRVIRIQRNFIVFGFVIYGLFGILDYFAMPQTHQYAWFLRAFTEPFAIFLFVASFYRSFQIRMYWLLNLWMLVMNISILVMIAISQPGELAFTYYPIGLMLVLISGYITSGHLGYASIQGWLAIGGYVFVAVIHQQKLTGSQAALEFLTIGFFLLGLNIIGIVLGFGLERTNRLAFLQRRVIEEQHHEAEALRSESERLLLNVLPASVAERLKHGDKVADYIEEASILFADIANFTQYSAKKSPTEVVALLNQIFSAFDQLTEKYELEKIKTIGDSYMVVSGLSPRPDHLVSLVEMALEMQEVMENFRKSGLFNLDLRIGINTGPVIAGIIGYKKFSYDLWGDAVNVASRMEAFGVLNKIQVTKDVYNRLKDRYRFRKRGLVQVKGMGEMNLYLLLGSKKNIDEQRHVISATHPELNNTQIISFVLHLRKQ